MRDINGFINLDETSITNIKFVKSYNLISFTYKEKNYFYKSCKRINEPYYELIAEELAKEYDIPSVNYDLATYIESIGVISENFIKDKTSFYTIEELLKIYYKDDIKGRNNLDDIIKMIKERYKNENISNTLINQLINIFIFDVLIANIDRHDQNIAIVEEDDHITFNKLWDHGNMLSSDAIEDGNYSLHVNREDYITRNDNILEHFLEKYETTYMSILEEKLKIISEENINSILNRVEERIGNKITPFIKIEVIHKFKENNEMIKSEIKKRKSKKKGLK